MNAYDEAEDLPASPPPPRAITVTLLGLLAVVLVGVVGVFLYAVGPSGDSAPGALPRPGSGRDLVYELIPVLNDDAAIAGLIPANTPTERANLRSDCGALTHRDPDVTIFDGVTPTAFRVVLDVSANLSAETSCLIEFHWREDEGWHASTISYSPEPG